MRRVFACPPAAAAAVWQLNDLLQVRGDEVVALLRRQSRGPATTTSSFRGVTKHAKGKYVL